MKKPTRRKPTKRRSPPKHAHGSYQQKVHRESMKSSTPWFLLSGAFALALCAVVLFCFLMAQASHSVVPNPCGQPEGALDVPLAEEPAKETDSRAIDWAYWQAINPDIVAWINVPGTSIDYAVVQAQKDDPTYYLSHDIYRRWNPYGCPYIDAACEGIASPNTVIFGHNMAFDSSMFADFARYSDAEFAASHAEIILQIPDAVYTLSVSAAEIIDGTTAAKRTDFSTCGELISWYAARFMQAPVQLSLDTESPALFTFVTCSYSRYANERTVVYAQPSQQDWSEIWNYH